MTASVTFRTTMFVAGNNTGIEVSPEHVEHLGAGKRAPVVVDVNGFVYRSTIGVMGGRFLIPFSSDKREATGLGAGDSIEVVLTVDDAPRTVEVPQDLADALVDAGARGAFDALAPSRRKAHVVAVEGAKTDQTRARRVASVVASLAD